MCRACRSRSGTGKCVFGSKCSKVPSVILLFLFLKIYRICERADCAEFSAPSDCLDISEIIVFRFYIDIKISSREVLYHALAAAGNENKSFAAELFRVKMEFFVFVITTCLNYFDFSVIEASNNITHIIRKYS